MVTQNRTVDAPMQPTARDRRAPVATDSKLLRRLGALEIVVLVIGAILVGI